MLVVSNGFSQLPTTVFISASLGSFSFSIYGWARHWPVRGDVSYVTSSLTGWDLAQAQRRAVFHPPKNDWAAEQNHLLVIVLVFFVPMGMPAPQWLLCVSISNQWVRNLQILNHHPDYKWLIYLQYWILFSKALILWMASWTTQILCREPVMNNIIKYMRTLFR